METTQDNRKNLAAEQEAEKPVAWRCCVPGQDPVLLFDEPSDERYPKGYKEPLYTRPEPEAEPVAYLFDADSYCDHAPIKDELVQSLPKGILRQKIKNVRPLYTRPEQSRKPMTEEEIKMALLIRGFPYDAFRAGVRFAEKHHGIGGDDE